MSVNGTFFSGTVFSFISTLNHSITNGAAGVAGFFIAQPVPEGLGAAQSVSPANALVTSTGASVTAFAGNSYHLLLSLFTASLGSAPDTDKAPAEKNSAEKNEKDYATARTAAFKNKSLYFSSPAPAGAVAFDFDGDGKADVSSRKPSNSEWKIKNSGSSNALTTVTVGTASAKAAPGDFDGDGKTDPATFSSGTWTIKKSSTGATVTISLGAANDIPVTGDYDGDGIADCAVYRPSNYTWYILQSSNNTTVTSGFGASGDIPVPGNYDGDSKQDIAVYRPSTGAWYVLGSTSGFTAIGWGIASDIPVPADYDGDGKTDAAVYRASTGGWYILKSSSTSGAYWAFNWGNYADQPAPADYDGDGKADLAVYRPTTGIWHIQKSCTYSSACGTGITPYDYQTLGTVSDLAVPSAYLKQIGGTVTPDVINPSRLSPRNATGSTDLYSRNFSWGTPLVSLPGRAGMDMGFGIGYNSLVWTKFTDAANGNTPTVVFDADQSNVTPGFRFGLPTIEPVYYDQATSTFNYLMISPSGARTNFKQVNGASDTYETQDSSYLQLKTAGATSANDPVENITITVTGTDGTKANYTWKGGAFRCSQVTDRNGNYITVVYDEQGLLRTMTDTLNRVVTVNYDSELYPISITQNWKDGNGAGATQTHTYAVFEYQTNTINTAFASGTAVIGPQNGTVMKVLSDIAFADGTRTFFNYNSYGQVWKVSNYAADNSPLNYARVDLSDNDLGSTAQTDSPRYSLTANWTANFNQNSSGTALEAISRYETTTQTQTLTIGGINVQNAVRIKTSLDNEPNGHYTYTYLGSSGWREGLPLASEDYANGTSGAERKRWTSQTWTQDDPNLSYVQNPRVTETQVGDANNIKKTTTAYYLQDGSLCATGANTNAACYGLPKEMKVYDASQTTALKTVKNEYNLGAAYLSRRIIGLPSKSELYDSGNNLVSKATYQYDEGDFTDTSLNQNLSSAVQHDNSNYGSSFITGRGNQTSMTRYDVSGQTSPVSSNVKYNTTGAEVSLSDSLSRTTKISYADAFNDATSRSAFAYPTTVIDPAGNSSQIQYRYDTGANVWAKSPDLNATTAGKESTREYDSVGRLVKQKIVNTGAYTRYEYPTNNIQSKIYTTIVDTNNNGADSADEVLSETWTDGAGRVRQSRTPFSWSGSSVASWSGQLTEYNILGEVKRQSVSTEINSSWTPTGDDYRGLDANNHPIWLWNSQEYDWKGRTIRVIPSDSTGADGKDQLISYDGCGCAGGQVMTLQGALVSRDDNPAQTARRVQKSYADVLGRVFKTQTMNWDGSTPYSTVVNSFNGRDQVTQSAQYAGADSISSTSQTTTLTYDGFGRLKTKHIPQQDANTLTSYNYNADDSISSVVDARGAAMNYTYNSLGRVSQISSAVPQSSSIPVAPTVTYTYDNAGNRTQMTDGQGNVAYTYDSLSHLTSETRQFTDTLSDAPLSSNRFKLEYTYALGGQLQSYKDPYGQEIDYARDKIGRLSSVTGSSFAGVSTFADSPQYRAWGGLKSLSYGDGAQAATTFNNRLQADSFTLTKSSSQVMSKSYDYYADGGLKSATDALNSKFDRLNIYDQVGRIKEAKSGAEAHGQTISDQGQQIQNLPYRQSYSYDAFGNMTGRTNLNWGGTYLNNFSFSNDRVQNWSYDADGRVIDDVDGNETTYDSAGRMSKTTEPLYYESERFFDGDGREVKHDERHYRNFNNNPHWITVNPQYSIRSTVFGGEVVTEANGTGKKAKTYVLAAGAVIAEQKTTYYANSSQQVLNFRHDDASGMSSRVVSNGTVVDSLVNDEEMPGELDPIRNNAGIARYVPDQNTPEPVSQGGDFWSDVDAYGIRTPPMATLDGQQVSNTLFMALGRAGGLAITLQDAKGNTKNVDLDIQLGQIKYYQPDSGRTPPNDTPSHKPKDPETIDAGNTLGDGGIWKFLTLSVSWNTDDGTLPKHSSLGIKFGGICLPKSFDNLSKEGQARLDSFGVTKEYWDKLSDAAKLGFWNVLGKMASQGNSLTGLKVDVKGNGITQDRTYFTAERDVVRNLRNYIENSPRYMENRSATTGIPLEEHTGIDKSYRENVAKQSAQIGFGINGRTVEIDIDIHNPSYSMGQEILHGGEIADNHFGHHLTNPYDVADRRFWECQYENGFMRR